LEVLIDWNAIRSSLKSDVRSMVVASGKAGLTGSSGLEIAGSALGTMVGSALIDTQIDGSISPQTLLRFMQEHPNQVPQILDRMTGAHFVSPTQFRIDFRGVESSAKFKFSALMTMTGATWRVSRIVLPLDEITKVTSH
jgi:hypothetical protein